MNNRKPIIAAKGGGGGASTPPKPDPESLRSREYARIIDIISEGPIGGPVDSNLLKSVYLDGVPVIAPNGDVNIQGVTATFRPGTALQEYVAGFPASEFNVDVQVEVKQATPITRSVTTLNANSVRVRVMMPQAQKQDSASGAITGVVVDYKLMVHDKNNALVAELNDRIEGRTQSKYTRQKELPLSGQGPWTITMARVTPDSTDSGVQDKIVFDLYSEVIHAKLSRPNTAYIALQIDATQYNRIPSRSYMMRGREVRVPSNFDETTRQYVGTWNGMFKTAVSDDPAWVWYDLATNARYGMGKYADVSMVNKYTMYEISKFCNQMVKDGKGGLEPRFTCNTYIQTAKEAYAMLKELASVFNAVPMYSSSFIAPIGDYPRDVDKIFTPANVIDGEFQYVGVSAAQRHTVAIVAWNDPSNGYKRTIEYVSDDSLIARWGVSTVSLTAIACTSRGQAQRLGRLVLEGERVRNEVVNFAVGLDNIDIMPGMVVQISDPLKTGKRSGGRLLTGSTSTVLKLDKYEVVGGVETLTVVMPDGKVASRTVSRVSGNEVTLSSALPFAPTDHASWLISGSTAQKKLYVVRSVTESSKALEFNVVCEPYDPEMQTRIDNQVNVQVSDVIRPPLYVERPKNIKFQETLVLVNDLIQTNIAVSWDPVPGAREYVVQWKIDSGNWKTETALEASFVVANQSSGTLTVQIAAVPYVTSTLSPATIATYTILGDSAPPEPVQNLALLEPFAGKGLRIKWDRVLRVRGYTVRILKATDNSEVRRIYLGNVNTFEYSLESMRADGGPWRNIIVEVRAEGVNGLSGPWASLAAKNPPPAMLTGVLLTPGIRSIFFDCDPCKDTDLAGYLVWLSKDSTFEVSDANLASDTQTNNAAIMAFTDNTQLEPGTTYYIRAAAYDDFGRDELNVSGSIAIVPLGVAAGLKPGEITGEMLANGAVDLAKLANDIQVPKRVDTLPTTNEGVLVFLTTDNKLYRWDGTKYTKNVDATDITGELDASQIKGLELDVGQGNMLFNSSFEFLDLYPWYTGLAGSVISQGVGRNNNGKSAVVTANADIVGPTTGWISRAGAGVNLAIPVEGGVKYTFSFYARRIAGTGAITFTPCPYRNLFPETFTPKTVPVLNDQWQRFVYTYEPSAAVLANGNYKRAISVAFVAENFLTGDAFEIDDAQLEAGQLTPYAPKPGEIASKSIFAVYIADGAITADKISASSITGDKISAGTISADKLSIGNFSNLMTDGSFEVGGSVWFLNSNFVLTNDPAGAFDGKYYVSFAPDTLGRRLACETKSYISVTPGDYYHFSGAVKSGATTSEGGALAKAYWSIEYYDSNKNKISEDVLEWTQNTSWTVKAKTIQIPANVYFIRPVLVVNYSKDVWYFDAGKLYRVNDATTIADGAITTGKIAAGAITAVNIAANAITSDKIAANAITAGKIAAGVIGASHIAAGSITADKLLVGNFNNLVDNATFLHGSMGWNTIGQGASIVEDAANAYGGSKAYLSSQGTTGTSDVVAQATNRIEVSQGDEYFFRGTVKGSPDATGTARWRVSWLDKDGAELSTTDLLWLAGSTSYTSKDAIAAVPTNAVYMQVNAARTGQTSGTWYFGEVYLSKATSSTMITNGAITTDKLMVNSITGDKIAANTIDSNLIKSNAVTTDKLAANSVVAGKISAGAVTADKISAGTITSMHISSRTITADKIAAGTLTANEIAAGSISADKIDSRNLTIKDSAGNVIFGAGTNLNVSKITGLGSLATQSSVSSNQVSGLGSLATQNSVASNQVSGLGALATKSVVAASDLSVGQLSAISANIGTVNAGIIYNNNASSWINMNATGSSRFLNIGSSFFLNADGTGSIDSKLLSAIQVFTGSVSIAPTERPGTNHDFTVVHNRGRPVIFSAYIIDTGGNPILAPITIREMSTNYVRIFCKPVSDYSTGSGTLYFVYI